MTKQEFLETLRRMLNRELTEAEVNENIRYYDSYISQEVRTGKTEAQVLSELGDPRLIARTILQVDNQKEEKIFTEEADGSFSQSYESEKDANGTVNVHSFSGAKVWLIVIGILFVLFLLLRTAFALFVKLLPVILVIAGVMWVKRKFFS